MNKVIRNIGIVLGILILASIVAIAANGYAGIVKTTKSPGYSAIFGNFVEQGADWSPGNPAEIINVTFYLPVNAYIYVSSSGSVSLTCGGLECPDSAKASMWISIDQKLRRADWDEYRFHEAFSVSSMYKLKKGYHTAYLMGDPHNDAQLGSLSANIVVIATQKGTIGDNSWFIEE